ncbi:MAG: MG2 domain-containing protein, partial [Candidatus Gracilibacteria bacterium]|nr:MG2 domain-containing protein [Candidatus Gracilibacteria bacterium]
MNFDILKEKIKLFFQTIIENKIYLTSFILFIVISVTSLYVFIDYKNNGRNSFYGKIAGNFIQAQVVSGNFDIDYKKIPYNIPSIELKFNKKIDEKTVTNKNFTIRPEIKGKIKVEGNTIKYVFDQAKLPVGTEIEVNATSEIKTRLGENISPYYDFLQIGEAPKVVKIVPTTKTGDEKSILNNLSSHISVFFNVPMVSLTDLDSADKLPCLIDVEPKVEGTCTWTTTSMLEFIPKSPLNGSSSYKIKVSNKDGTLYNLEKEYNSNLETTALSFSINEENYENIYTFSPNNGLKINSNFPVSKEELQKNIVLENIISDNGTQINTNNSNSSAQNTLNNLLSGEKKAEKVENIKFSIEQIKGSDTNFLIKSDSFKYNKNYKISFKGGINSLKGNKAFEKNKTFSLKTNNFINNINVYQKRFSSTGAELDPLYTTNYIYNLANKNAYLDIYLDEEIQNLSKDFFAFVDSKGNKINYTLSYFKDEAINDKGEHFQKEDKKHIKLEIQEILANSSKFKFIVSKNVNKSLESDLIYEYSTSIPLKALSNKYISYNKNCVYTNTNLGFSGTIYNKDFSINFGYTPDAKIFSIGEYEANMPDRDYSILIPWEKQDAFNSLSNEEKNKQLVSLGLCPMAPEGQILYVINHRLNPNSSYKFETKQDAKDLYGNKITNSITSNINTGNDIKDIDKYVYTTVSKEISVIPKQASIVFPVQTINLDSMTFDICEMNKAGYLDYLKNRYNSGFNPICTNQVKKNLAVKNKNWNLSYTKFDIEKDILGNKSNSNFILIRGYGENSGYKAWDDGKSFQNLYIRSDMQAYMEVGGGDKKTGTNKSLLFLTDFSGNPISSLENEAYVRKYDSNGNSNFSKINLAFKYEKDGVYATNSTNLGGSVIFLKSGDKEAVITTEQDEAGNYDFGYNGGIDSYTKDFLYLYTDRPIYKPGDKVYFKGLSRLFSINGYKKVSYKTGKLELIDSNYKTIKSIDVKLDNNSNFAGEFDLSKEAGIGKYSFRFTVNGEEIINNASFDIEEYVKPVFKVNLSQDKKDFMLGEETKIKVNPEYYFGGKVISTKGTYSVLSQNYFFDSKEYGDYQFGETNNYFDCLYWGYCSYDDNLVQVQEFNIDSTGNYDLNYKYPRDIKTGEKLYTITAEVEDPDTKKVVSNSVTNILHNTDGYLGISLPWWNDKKTGIKFSGVVLDYEAKALENKGVKLEIYKREYKQVKKQGVDGNFYNDYTYEDKLEDSINLKSDNKGKIEKNIFPKSDGTYFIKAIYTGKNGQNFISSKEIYISGDNYIDWNNGNNDVTDLVADKSLVNPGEIANYTLKSPVNNGKALILVEKDDGVIDYVVHTIKSYSDRITIP